MIAQSFARARTFSSLVKLSHTVFALPFAAAAVALSTLRPPTALTGSRALLMLAAMVTARTAAMAYNRYLDRDIDAENPRTRDREVPSGVVSPGAALALTIGASMAFVASAVALGRWPGLLSVPVLAVLLGYSFTSGSPGRRISCSAWRGARPRRRVGRMGADPEPAFSPHVGRHDLGGGGFDVLYSLQTKASTGRTAYGHSCPLRDVRRGGHLGRAARRDGRLPRRVRPLALSRSALLRGHGAGRPLLVYEHALAGGQPRQDRPRLLRHHGYLSCAFSL